MQTTKSNFAKIMITGLFSSVFTLSACQSIDKHPHSNDKQHENMPYQDGMYLHMRNDHKASVYQQAYQQGMQKMHADMMAGTQANDADVAFAKGMLPHHQGAVAMAKVQLKYGKNSTLRQLAKNIIDAQQAEIEQMNKWLASHPDTAEQSYTQAMQQDYKASMQSMQDDMMQGINSNDADMAFAKGMLPHHQGAVAMAKVQLKYGKVSEMRQLARNIIDEQQSEIKLMQNWIANHS